MSKVNAGAIDWLKLETKLRSILRTAKNMPVDSKAVFDFALLLQEISEAVGYETARGFELDSEWYKKYDVLQEK